MNKTANGTIKKEIKENEEQINRLNNKIHLLEINKTEFKLLSILTYSVIPWILINAVLIPTTITSIGPIQIRLLTALSILAPTSIGVLVQKIRSINLNKNISKFTNAETQSEIIEELLKNEILKEKLITENKILEKVSEKTNTNTLSNNTQEELNKELEEKYQEIEVILTQKVLREKGIKDKSDIVSFPFISIVELMGLYYIPTVITNMMGMPFQLTNLDSIIPVILGTSLGLGYVIKRNKDYKKAFNNINQELGQNAIDMNEKYKEKEQNELNNQMQLDYLIDKISNIKLELETIKNQKDISTLKEEITTPTLELNQSLDREIIVDNKVKKRIRKK